MVELRKTSEDSCLQTCVDTLNDWSKDSYMKLNAKKCFVMDVCYSKSPPLPTTLSINDHVFEICQAVKLLGVYIQANLKWDTHISYIVRRANSKLYILRSLKRFGLPVDDLVTVYLSTVRPILRVRRSRLERRPN